MDVVTKLHEAIAAVCPIVGVAIGDPADKSTWRIDFTAEATDEQKAAAQAALTAFDPTYIDPADVTAEAQRRFMAISADARAMKDVLGTAIPADIVTLSQAIMAKGTQIAAMTPIPQDYAADSWWPAGA